MIRLNLTALLYSNRNIDLAYKAKKICRNVNINLINAIDFVDLTVKIVELKPQLVFFDLTTVKLEEEIMQLFVSKGEYYIPNIVLIYENKEQLKYYETFSFSAITLEELEGMLVKQEKNFKITRFHRGSEGSAIQTGLIKPRGFRKEAVRSARIRVLHFFQLKINGPDPSAILFSRDNIHRFRA